MTEPLAEIGTLIIGLDHLAADLLVSIRDPAITKVMNSVTGLGSATAAAVIVGLLYLAEWYEEVATSVLALGLTGPVVLTLMGLVRDRSPRIRSVSQAARWSLTRFRPATPLASPFSRYWRRAQGGYRLPRLPPSPPSLLCRGCILARIICRIRLSASGSGRLRFLSPPSC